MLINPYQKLIRNSPFPNKGGGHLLKSCSPDPRMIKNIIFHPTNIEACKHLFSQGNDYFHLKEDGWYGGHLVTGPILKKILSAKDKRCFREASLS